MTRSILFVAALMVAAQSLAGGLIATIPHGSTSQVLRVPLYDQDTPDTCPSTDLTSASSGLSISISSNLSATPIDTNTSAGSTIEPIAASPANGTIGTFATPTAGKTRFEVSAAGSCWYELQFENTAFSTANADRLYIEISDGGLEIMDAAFWVDMTAVAQDTLVDAVWNEVLTGHTTADTAGKYLKTDVSAILVDTETTLDGIVDSILEDTGTTIPASLNTARTEASLWIGAVDTVTSQTLLIVADGPAAADTHVGRSMCIKDTGDAQETDCALITDYNQSTLTWTLANALKFTVAAGDVMFIPANDANIKAMNNAEVCGNGQTGTLWTGNGC